MRNIQIETYWKMMNSFWYKSGKINTYKLFKEKLLSEKDEKLNSLSIEEWNNFSVEEFNNKEMTEVAELLKNKDSIPEKDFQEKIALYSFQDSQEISYNRLPQNSATLISWNLFFLGKIESDQIIPVASFIFMLEMEIYKINLSNIIPKNSVDINFSPLSFEEKDEWIIDILSEVGMFGYQLFLKHNKYIILPFWDWTMTLIFDSLNLEMAKKEIPEHSNFIEIILENNIEEWEVEKVESNMEYDIKGTKVEGEIDFVFLKNEVLYVFENKNITDMHKPTENNFEIWKSWKEKGIEKGVNQLEKVLLYSEEIFKNWDFKKIVPILCTTSINRMENSNILGIKPNDSITFLDLDSLLYLLTFKKGYEVLLFMSMFAKKNLRTGLYDMVDVLGILSGLKKQEYGFETSSINYDENYLSEIFEYISDLDLPIDKNAHLMGEWKGNYRSVFPYLQTKFKTSNFIDSIGIKNALKNLSNSKKIKVLKFIFGNNIFYNKITGKIQMVGID